MRPIPATAERIDSLNAVRALAFLGIVVFHCGFFATGACSVSVFLILSGFLMVYSYHKKTLSCSLRDRVCFSWNKIKKLYPLHIVMVCVSILLAIITNSIVTVVSGVPLPTNAIIPLYLGFVVVNVLLIQSWFPVSEIYFSLNGVAWYLSTLMFLYAMFPLLLKWIQRFFSVRRAVILICLVYVVQCVTGYIAGNITIPVIGSLAHWFTYVFPPFRLGDFVIGCCMGYLFLHKKTVLRVIPATIAELAAFAVIAVSVMVFSRQPNFIGADCFRYTVLNTPGSVLLILTFANASGILSKLLTRKPLLFIGKISPYGFLIHQPICKLLRYLFQKVWLVDINIWLFTIMVLGLTVILSLLFMRAEQFIRRRRDQKADTIHE